MKIYRNVEISQLICTFVAFMLTIDNFDCPNKTQKLSNTVNQSRSRPIKIIIFNNHVDQNMCHSSS